MVEAWAVLTIWKQDSLEVAVLSSFQWHLDWLLPKLNVGNTYLVLVMQGKTEEDVSVAP